ncbi:MAG: DNA polymerase/3'-5' exonuclease PolX [Phycisphaerae bacterium]
MENAQVAEIFDEIADLIELDEGNAFRIRSYRSAARTVRDLSERLEDLLDRGKDLSDLPNIGESTAEKIHEILDTGTCRRLEEMRQKVPPALVDLMRVPNLGPRKAMQLHRELDVESLDDLRKACEREKVRGLEGFGAKTEEKLLKGLKTLEAASGRFLYKAAADHVESLGRHLDGLGAVKRWEVAGSFRRRKETVGDLDILVQASDRDEATEAILRYGAIDEVASRGTERVTVRLASGLQVDFRYFEPPGFGAALMYFTGSKAHNIGLRKRAVDRGWKLNEYGLTKDDRQLAGKTEESVYHRLNLEWVPPELREDRGEIEAADSGDLPDLVEAKHIRGDLQAHTDATDGANTIREMARAAADRGYQFFAITDHSKRVTMAGGLDDDAARRHADAIREVDDDLDDLWLMAGIEVDVLKSGQLDLQEKTLASLDWVVASIHYDRNLDRDKMTDRYVAAVESGVVHCLGHPLGRVIGQRDPLPLDLDRLFDACRARGVWIEINAQPDRLDLPDTHVKRARDAGVQFTLGTDAHKVADLDFMALGVGVARRGWLEKKDILNTRTARQLRKRLKK